MTVCFSKCFWFGSKAEIKQGLLFWHCLSLFHDKDCFGNIVSGRQNTSTGTVGLLFLEQLYSSTRRMSCSKRPVHLCHLRRTEFPATWCFTFEKASAELVRYGPFHGVFLNVYVCLWACRAPKGEQYALIAWNLCTKLRLMWHQCAAWSYVVVVLFPHV